MKTIKMTRSQALSIKTEFMDLCKKYGLWVKVNEEHKPELKDIILTVSVRVNGK